MAALLRTRVALRALPKAPPTTVPRRSLHMTGPTSFTTLLTSDRPTAAAIKAELDFQQKQVDAIEASAYHQQPIRHFNTSRSFKAVGDTSTIDFAYMPDFDPDTGSADGATAFRVPLLPAGLYETLTSYAKEAPEEAVMRPEIVTASAVSTHISLPRAFGEVHDNSAVDISTVAQDVASAADPRSGPAEGESGMVRTIWNGMVEDLFGARKTA